MSYDPRAEARTPHAFDRAAPPMDHGGAPIAAERYYSRSWAAAEWDRIFTQTWLLAAVSADLREAGDFVRFDVAHESFIVVRGVDGRVHAHYNVCPHRGSRIVLADNGSVERLTCPFHDWKFELDGRNCYVADAETFRADVLGQDRSLSSVRCEEAAGLVFLTMNERAPPLREWLAPLLGGFEGYRIDLMNVVQHRRADWHANWKIGVDAFYEAYHLHALHPQTLTMMDDRTQIDLYAGGFSRQIVPFARPSSHYEDQSGINPAVHALMLDAGVTPDQMPSDARLARAAIAGAKRRRSREFGLGYEHFSDAQLTDAVLCGVFPNVQIVCHPEAVFVHRFLPRPDAPEQMLYDTMILYRHVDVPGYRAPAWMGLAPDADLTGATRPTIVHTRLDEPSGMGEVLDQDSRLVPLVQQGVRSRGYRGMLLSEQEVRLRHFHAEVDRHVLG